MQQNNNCTSFIIGETVMLFILRINVKFVILRLENRQSGYGI